jgi:hypothetical protein
MGAEPTVRPLCPAGTGHLVLKGQGSQDKGALVVPEAACGARDTACPGLPPACCPGLGSRTFQKGTF